MNIQAAIQAMTRVPHQVCAAPSSQPSISPALIQAGALSCAGPSASLSPQPSKAPSMAPSSNPSEGPSGSPSSVPSTQPSFLPTTQPTLSIHEQVYKSMHYLSTSPAISQTVMQYYTGLVLTHYQGGTVSLSPYTSAHLTQPPPFLQNQHSIDTIQIAHTLLMDCLTLQIPF